MYARKSVARDSFRSKVVKPHLAGGYAWQTTPPVLGCAWSTRVRITNNRQRMPSRKSARELQLLPSAPDRPHSNKRVSGHSASENVIWAMHFRSNNSLRRRTREYHTPLLNGHDPYHGRTPSRQEVPRRQPHRPAARMVRVELLSRLRPVYRGCLLRQIRPHLSAAGHLRRLCRRLPCPPARRDYLRPHRRPRGPQERADDDDHHHGVVRRDHRRHAHLRADRHLGVRHPPAGARDPGLRPRRRIRHGQQLHPGDRPTRPPRQVGLDGLHVHFRRLSDRLHPRRHHFACA